MSLSEIRIRSVTDTKKHTHLANLHQNALKITVGEGSRVGDEHLEGQGLGIERILPKH